MEAAACGRLPRLDDEEVRAEPGKFLRDVDPRPLADGNQKNDGHHADDHAQHGQARPDLVRQDGFEGHPECLKKVHAMISSLTIPPSFRLMILLHLAATPGSWVTMTMVTPCLLRPMRMFRISSPE